MARRERIGTATALALTAALASAAVARAEKTAKLEEVFADPKYQLTGAAVSARGRVFTNYPVWSAVHANCVVEVLPGNQARPYPNAEMNSWKPGDDGIAKWVSVQAVYVDDRDKLWVVDAASPNFAGVYRDSNKLVRIDLATDKVERTYRFTGVTDQGAYINDVRVDTRRQVAYLTNSSQGALLVVDLKSGKARQLLEGTKPVLTDLDYRFEIGGREVAIDGKPLKVNSDGLALCGRNQWLFFKPLTDDKLYKVKTADLRNAKLREADLLARVVDLGHVAVTDGMECDAAGNLYFGDLQRGALLKIAPDLTKTTLVEDPRLVWPDAYALSRDGYLYVSTSQVHMAPPFNGGADKRTLPYGIFRIKVAP